ncbi:MAG: zinc ribbon domain-containing protein [Xanthomonadales bacterium]|nr:zinc ribbon domain-containing protein [Xanthomonadales bacterium]
MAMTTCKECSKEISDTAKACPHCGAKVPHASVWPWIIGVPIALFVAMMVIGTVAGSSPEAQAKAQARDAIAYCWKQQADKALDPSTQRFVASTCEKMENDFRTKYSTDP